MAISVGTWLETLVFFWGDFPAMQKIIKNGVQQSHERRFIAGSTKQMVGFLPTLCSIMELRQLGL